ncbi:hypothetical protein IU459_13170 [Nocardia amamiensis]|uniref:Uncharacterized protein n=1 Tax=Nocardia amamiensis TaxID=404578 RepID=A0ABS0CPF5_9NOCA|nr:hypothetical protein [Nocardia amamiensis]MBF6298489.1 hypothetical protein [Nocardia amamiensis]
MSARSVEATMPARAADCFDAEVAVRPAPPRSPVRLVCTAPFPMSQSAPAAQPSSSAGLSTAELEARLIAAHQRAADLEEQLAAVVAARDAAEHQAAQLEDRNRELASDLDNALDQLAGHALHVEQERLIHTPVYGLWAVSTDREDYDR